MKRILLFLLFPLCSFGQATRVDVPLQTSGPNVPTSGGPLPQALWVANATVTLCLHSAPPLSFSACQAAPITTYTDSTLTTACPTATPMVQLPGSTCTKSAGAAGNLGLWYAAGLIVDYWVTSTYGTFGPYTITGGGGGGGAGNPAPPAFAAQFANSAVNQFQGDSKILINPTLHSFQAAINSGSAYATGYGNGTTNGIASATAAGQQTVVSDPTYPSTENYGTTAPFPATTNPFHWQDLRNGRMQDFFTNWGFTGTLGALFSTSQDAHPSFCLVNNPWSGGTSNSAYSCTTTTVTDTTPGVSLGNPAVPPLSGGNWQTGFGTQFNYTTNGSGIREDISSTLNHYGIGDTADYFNINSRGGAKATSDEGTEFATHVLEVSIPTFGVCSTGCTTGSTQIKATLGTNSGGQGTGQVIIDTTQGPIANTITNLAAGLNSSMEAVTVSTPIAQSTAWGTLTANVQPTFGNLTSFPFSTNKTFNVTVVSGTFNTSAPFCFSDQFNDVTVPTSITGSGTVTIAAPVYRPHGAGAYVFQGGMCGYGLEILSNTAVSGSSNKYLATIVGSTSTTVLQVVFFRIGSAFPTPYNGSGNFNSNMYATGNITSLTSSGTTVYASGVTAGTFATQSFKVFNKSNVFFTNASDSALNTVCTGLTWLSGANNDFTCTIAGLTGTHTGATANYQLSINGLAYPLTAAGTASAGSTTYTGSNLANLCAGANSSLYLLIAGFTNAANNGVFACSAASTSTTLAVSNASGTSESHAGTATVVNLLNAVNLWPVAETLDVQNESLSPPSMDGSFTLMANPVAFATNDNLIQLNSDAASYLHRFSNFAVNNFAYQEGIQLSVGGTGAQGGSQSFSSPTAIRITNVAPTSLTYDGGGTVGAPSAIAYSGAMYDGLKFSEGPVNSANGLGAFSVGVNTNQSNDPSYSYYAFNTANKSGTSSTLLATPFLGDWSMLANGLMSVGGTTGGVNFSTSVNGATFQDRITFAALANVGGLTVAQGPGAGTLADGTYCYQVEASNNSGRTPVQTEVCAAVANGGANTVKVSWNRDPGATSYIVYGRTTGAEAFMTTIGATQLYFIDNGTISPSGAPQSTNTSLGYINNAKIFTTAEFSLGTCTTAATVAASNGNRQVVTLTNADTCALTFTQPAAGTANITLKVIQSSVSTFNGGISGCKWPGGAVPTITQTSAAIDFISIYLDGTNAFCTASQNFQ